MPTRWRRAAASGSSSTPPRCPRCPRHSSSPRPESGRAATAATATTPGRTSRAPPATLPRPSRSIPQTAGGLLVSLPADKAAVLTATFAATRARSLPDRSRPGRLGRRATVAGMEIGSDGVEQRDREGASPAPGFGPPLRPARGRRRLHALGRRHERGGRTADGVRPRVRQLAALRRQAVSGEGRPRGDRVQQPPGGARRDPPDGDRLARRAAGRRAPALGAEPRARHRRSGRSRRFHSAASRCSSTSTRSR